MAFEKRWKKVAPKLFTANGTIDGIVTVSSTRGFYAKQKVFLKSNTISRQKFEVKEVLSKTQLRVGPATSDMREYSNLSAFTTAQAAQIDAEEQARPAIPEKEFERAAFEEEPVVAKRVFLVDEIGEGYSSSNPIPVQLSDGSINIGTVNAELEVQLSHKDNDPDAGDVHDSVRVGDGVDTLGINPDGSINVIIQNSIATGDVISIFNEVSAVASGIQTNVLTYVVPALKTLALTAIEVGGSNIAEYEVWIAGVLRARKRTWFSGPLNEIFPFGTSSTTGLEVATGVTVQVKVLHNRPMNGNFEARLIGELID